MNILPTKSPMEPIPTPIPAPTPTPSQSPQPIPTATPEDWQPSMLTSTPKPCTKPSADHYKSNYLIPKEIKHKVTGEPMNSCIVRNLTLVKDSNGKPLFTKKDIKEIAKLRIGRNGKRIPFFEDRILRVISCQEELKRIESHKDKRALALWDVIDNPLDSTRQDTYYIFDVK